MNLYQAICLDPNWDADSGGGGKGANAHYPLLKPRDMVPVIESNPLWHPDRSGCYLFCWQTVSAAVRGDGLWLVRALGFTPKTKVYWKKVRNRLGIGQYVRHDIEEVIVATRGRVKVPQLKARDIVEAPPGEHSRKPDEMYDLFNEMVEASFENDCLRADIFSRYSRVYLGWDSWDGRLKPKTPCDICQERRATAHIGVTYYCDMCAEPEF